MERLPSRKGGSTLDLDSTALLHEDGHQEGVRVGHTRAGLKPCLHPPRRRRGIGRLVGGRAGGKLLLDCPGYKYQALLTNLPESVGALQVWRDYHGRAAIEGVIKELRHGFGLPGLCCKKFFATEAALSLAVLTYNLTVLFARHLGWLEPLSIGTLRYRRFGGAGILSRAQGVTTLKLGLPPPQRAWWEQIWTKLLSPLPNGNAVAQTP